MDLDLSTIKEKAKKYELGIGVAGFFMGVTAKDAPAGTPFFPNRLAAFVSRLGIAGVNIGGITTTNKFSFNPTGFLNKGLAAYIILSLIDGLVDGKEIDTIAAVGKPFALYYSLGGFLDPSPESAFTGSAGSGGVDGRVYSAQGVTSGQLNTQLLGGA